MLLPTSSSAPTSPTDWLGHQAAIQTSSSNAWSSSKIAAVTLGIILGIIVVGVLLCFVLYKIHRIIRDMVSKEVEVAINRLELGRGRSNYESSDPSSEPSPGPSDPPTVPDTSPADVLPPSNQQIRRLSAIEHAFAGFCPVSPRMTSPLFRSPERFQHPPSGLRAPRSSYERLRPRQCKIADLPATLPHLSAHGSDSPRLLATRMEDGLRERNVGELRAVVRRASSRASDYPRRHPPNSRYLSAQRRPPPPNPPPSPEREREGCQRQEPQPTNNYFPTVIRRESSRHFSSSRSTSSRRRTSYAPPYVNSDSQSDRGSAESSR